MECEDRASHALRQRELDIRHLTHMIKPCMIESAASAASPQVFPSTFKSAARTASSKSQKKQRNCQANIRNDKTAYRNMGQTLHTQQKHETFAVQVAELPVSKGGPRIPQQVGC